MGLLGTMQINVQDPPITLRDPAILYSNGTTHFSFKGLRANPNPNESSFGFYIEIVTYLNGSSTPSYRAPATQRVVYLTNRNTITNLSSMKVEFYFVSWENSSVFIPGEQYELVQGTVGAFNLTFSSIGNIHWKPEYILLEGQTIDPNTNIPTTPVPIIGSGPTSTLPGTVPYVDDDNPYQELQYLLSILEQQAIVLSEAYGSNRAKIAKARIDLVNATPATNYKIDIKFDSPSVEHGFFHLHLDGEPSLYRIPYKLYFKNDHVVPGSNIRWENLLVNSEEIIEATSVNSNIAELAPSGTYQDTITVSITAVD